MGFFDKIRQNVSRFMAGRYGADQLNFAIVITALVLTVVGSLLGIRVVTTLLADALLILAFYRILSKDRMRRQSENQAYLDRTMKVRRGFSEWMERFKNRKKYHYFTCPKCHTRLRVPRGVGNVTITCRACGEKFDKKA